MEKAANASWSEGTGAAGFSSEAALANKESHARVVQNPRLKYCSIALSRPSRFADYRQTGNFARFAAPFDWVAVLIWRRCLVDVIDHEQWHELLGLDQLQAEFGSDRLGL